MTVQSYTPELTEKLKARYAELVADPTQHADAVTILAQEFNKPEKSIRSKLVKEKVYVAPDKPKKEREDGPTKKELVKTLTGLTGLDLLGIEGATKSALRELIDFLEEKTDETA